MQPFVTLGVNTFLPLTSSGTPNTFFVYGVGDDRVIRILYIGAYPMILYRLPAAAARSKMTFAVGRIRKCTLKLKLLVFLFCSPEVGLHIMYM